MKTKLILLCFGFFLITSISFAQKTIDRNSIIQASPIGKYHNVDDLNRKNKGELLKLYVERTEALVKSLPYIAFATKPGITLSSLGIPSDKDNERALEEQHEATDEFVLKNQAFQKRILPYSDTDDLVSAILFYEDVLKSLHQYSEFH